MITNGRGSVRGLGYGNLALLAVGATAALSGAIVLAAQAPAAAPAQATQTTSQQRLDQAGERFEVVSIRQTVSGGNAPQGARGGRTLGPRSCKGGPPQIDPGRIAFQNNSVYTLITMAYGMDCLNADALDLISGGPGWVKSDQYVIQAVIPEAAQIRVAPAGQVAGLLNGDPKLQLMLQNLLADRFKLCFTGR